MMPFGKTAEIRTTAPKRIAVQDWMKRRGVRRHTRFVLAGMGESIIDG